MLFLRVIHSITNCNEVLLNRPSNPMLTNIALYPGEEPGYEARLIMFEGIETRMESS